MQASVLENLRLAVRSQLGFTSIRLPTSGRRSNIWRRLFNFTRSRRSGSLALVSADAEEGAGSSAAQREPERTGTLRGLLPVDSDDTDTESDRRDVPGAVGGLAAPLPQKTPPASAVEAIVSVSASSAPPAPGDGSAATAQGTPTEPAPPPPDPAPGRSQLTSALSRVTRSLRWVRLSLGRAGGSAPCHSPLRHLDHSAGSRDEEDDVELLIPVSDAGPDSDTDSSRPLLESARGSAPGPALPPPHGRARFRDGPCEHCGMVHTAQVPDACLEATSKTETSDDEALLLC